MRLNSKAVAILILFLFLILVIPPSSANTKTFTDSFGDVVRIYEDNDVLNFEYVERPHLDITEFNYNIGSDYLEMQLKVAGQILNKNYTTYHLYFSCNILLIHLNIYARDSYNFYYENGNIDEMSPNGLIDYEIGNNYIRCRFILGKNTDYSDFIAYCDSYEDSTEKNYEYYYDECPTYGFPPFITGLVPGTFWGGIWRDIKIISYNNYNQTLNFTVDVYNRALFGKFNSHIGPINFTVEPDGYSEEEISALKTKPFISFVKIYILNQGSDFYMFYEFFSIGQCYLWTKVGEILTSDVDIEIHEYPTGIGLSEVLWPNINLPNTNSHLMNYLLQEGG